jgi:hypothetical protein
MRPSVSFLRVDVLKFRASNDPPNGGSRDTPKGDAQESPVTGRATANRGPNATGKHPQTIAATMHAMVTINTSSALHGRRR